MAVYSQTTDEQTQRFSTLFNGLHRAYGYTRISNKRTPEGKVQTHNKTVLSPLTTEKYSKHLQGVDALGVIPIQDGDTCEFGAIDIDDYEGLDHAKLAGKLQANDLSLIVCKSKSGGAHIYAFFDPPVDAYNARAMLMRISVVLGQPGVEIFPKQSQLASENDVGNWINLPYFNGERRAVDIDGNELTLDQFLDKAEANRISDLDQLQVTTPDAFQDGPPCCQQLATNGVPPGARNNALLAFGIYAQKKYPDDWEDVTEEYNRKFMDTPLSAEEVLSVIKSLRKKTYGYKCNESPLAEHCSRELCLSRRYGIQPGSGDNTSVQIDGLTKIETEPPIWFVEVEGLRVQLSTTELLDQGHFRKRVFEKTNKLIPRMKADNWEALLQEKIQTVNPEEAPEDASESGMLMDYLERWLADYPIGSQRSQLLLGMPVEKDGRVYFRSSDFYEFLQRNRFTTLSKPEIWSAFRNNKEIDHKQLNVQGRCVQVWVLNRPAQPQDVQPTEIAQRSEF